MEAESLFEALHRAGLSSDDFGAAFSFGSDWHHLHFALCGSTEALMSAEGQAVLGGVEHDEAEASYGPLRFHTPERVRWVAEGLRSLSLDLLRLRLAMPAPALYGGGGAERGDERCALAQDLRAFYDQAARAGQAVVLWVE